MTDKRFKLIYKPNTIIWDNFEDEEVFAWAEDDNPQEIVNKLNELHDENQIKLEIVDAFILGMEDEKGIAHEDREFQCRMDHTIRVLKRLKEDMLNPTEFKRLKELE